MRAQQRLVFADSIVQIRNPAPDTLVGYVFPRRAAIDYRHLRMELVPAYEAALAGLRMEVDTLRARSAVQDSVIASLHANEADLKTVSEKKESIIGELRAEWGAERARKRRWRSAALYGIPAALLVGVVAGAVGG